VALLIVDFEQDPPVVMDNMKIFLREGLIFAVNEVTFITTLLE